MESSSTLGNDAAADRANGGGASTSGRDGATPTPALDRDAFKQFIRVVALRVPNRKCSQMMKAFRGHTLDRPRLRCIVPHILPAAGEAAGGGDEAGKGATCPDTKLLLLEEGVTLEGLPAELRQLVADEGLEPTGHDVVLDYAMLSSDAVLKRLLPAGVDAPGSFETIGHIAHLNLREEQLPYRHVIGQVLLDKNPHLKTIVNKLGSIENEFRVFSMEVIAGEPRLETEVVQHGQRFRLDFSQVYWNSRLESEHLRLVSQCMARGQVLVDMMAGIGPFAVPAASRGLTVYANDLNPRSAYYMAVNVRLNRLGASVNVFNMDGRAFVRLLCDTPGGPAAQLRQQQQEQLQDQQQRAQGEQGPGEAAAAAGPQAAEQPSAAGASGDAAAAPGSPDKPPAPKRQRTVSATAAAAETAPPPPVPPGFVPPAGGLHFDHVVMNLPASAIEFLDAFSGAFDPATWAGKELPMVHCYTFKRAAETEEDILARAEHYLGGALDRAGTAVHTVRDVAPNKLMLCLSFRVPPAVAFKGRT